VALHPNCRRYGVAKNQNLAAAGGRASISPKAIEIGRICPETGVICGLNSIVAHQRFSIRQNPTAETKKFGLITNELHASQVWRLQYVAKLLI
jgi:hypothetical protein